MAVMTFAASRTRGGRTARAEPQLGWSRSGSSYPAYKTPIVNCSAFEAVNAEIVSIESHSMGTY